MNWRQSGFSKHYVILTVEGKNPEIFLSQCMRKGIYLRNVRYETPERIRAEASATDIPELEKTAGNRFEIHISGHGGYLHRAGRILRRKSFIAGILVFSAFMCYIMEAEANHRSLR